MTVSHLLGNEVNNVLLVLDAQGSELSIISKLDWNKPPTYILIEDDLRNNNLKTFIKAKGYKLLCDGDNLFFKKI
jgi:hypothetical protein